MFLTTNKTGGIIFKLLINFYLSIYGATVLCWTLVDFFSFLILYTVDRTLGRGISPSQGRYLHIQQHKSPNKGTQTFIPWVGFEPTIPAFERAKTIHALDRATNVICALINFRFRYSINTVYIKCWIAIRLFIKRSPFVHLHIHHIRMSSIQCNTEF
jgi:hypothetical protein